MGVSKNRVIPKWMVYNEMESPIKMDDLGDPYFWNHPHHLNQTFIFWGVKPAVNALLESTGDPKTKLFSPSRNFKGCFFTAGFVGDDGGKTQVSINCINIIYRLRQRLELDNV